jgi:hypothetical protein
MKDGPPERVGERIIEHGVINLLIKIDRAIMLGADMPDRVLPPENLQNFIEELCRAYG